MDTTDESFEQDVLTSDVPVLVDFWAPWCGPCRAISPIIEELGERHAGRLRVAKVNLDDNYVTGSKYGVLSLPTVILFVDGEPRETLVGARPRAQYERAIEAYV